MNYVEFLRGQGLDVAGRSFTGVDGRQWLYARHVPESGNWNALTKPGRQFFIQPDSGDWKLWGDAATYEWNSGPWHECYEGEPQPVSPCGDAETVDDGQHPFLRAAIAQGFEPKGSMSFVGNITGTYNGRLVIASTKTESFVANVGTVESFKTLAEIDEWRGTGHKPKEIQEPGTVTPAKPFVSMREKPIEFSGRTKQGSLFG